MQASPPASHYQQKPEAVLLPLSLILLGARAPSIGAYVADAQVFRLGDLLPALQGSENYDRHSQNRLCVAVRLHFPFRQDAGRFYLPIHGPPSRHQPQQYRNGHGVFHICRGLDVCR